MKTLNKQTKAFTIMELVFVIIILGILASLALPRMERDLRQEAKDHILSAIRLTQELALIDDKTNPSDANWQENLWKISFNPGGSHYTISSGDNFAVDPLNGKLMGGAGASQNILIGTKYSINQISGCEGGTIGFDNLGRPFTSFTGSTYAGYMNTSCNLLITFSDSGIPDINVIIRAETGYVSAI